MRSTSRSTLKNRSTSGPFPRVRRLWLLRLVCDTAALRGGAQMRLGCGEMEGTGMDKGRRETDGRGPSGGGGLGEG